MLKARGDGAKFDAQLSEYQKASDVTRRRMHLESLERILARVDKKTLLPDNLKGGILPLLSPATGLPNAEKKP